MSDVAPLTPQKRHEIERWASIDVEHGPRLLEVLESDPEQVAPLFDGRVAFGTAGLRAAMQPGPLGMNRLVVRQATQGLLDWLKAQAGGTSGSEQRIRVVVGYDARHHSVDFAHDVARVLLRGGAEVLMVDRPAPTPVMALAVLDHAADAGVMITASHNPAADNGYKLYLGDGLQLIPPADVEIAAAIERVAQTDPLAEPSEATVGDGWLDIADDALARHRAAAQACLVSGHRQAHVVYTAMHGVGGEHLLRCFAEAGFPEPAPVPSQFDPDPDFPTTPFPNPEEPGALDQALALAVDHGADLVLANDPDADRLAVAVPGATGEWEQLTGDEVGVLLADHLFRHQRPGPCLVSSSVVSSRLITAMAEHHGAQSVRTLTGFKWVARPIVDHDEHRFLFGYEEALGYCVGDRVRDKDGISAALLMAELAAECKVLGTSLRARLDELALAHGLYLTTQVSVRFDHLGLEQRAEAVSRSVQLDPAELAGVPVLNREDLSLGRTLPPTVGVVFDLADGSRVVIRPSGTEPKVKAYVEVVEPAEAVQSMMQAGRIDEVRSATNRRLADLATAVRELLDW